MQTTGGFAYLGDLANHVDGDAALGHGVRDQGRADDQDEGHEVGQQQECPLGARHGARPLRLPVCVCMKE